MDFMSSLACMNSSISILIDAKASYTTSERNISIIRLRVQVQEKVTPHLIRAHEEWTFSDE